MAAFRGRGRGRGICPPCNIKPAQQISFVVKYLSENAPEVISESLKLTFSWESMSHTPLVGHVATHLASTPFILSNTCFAPLGNFSECSTGQY